MESRETEGADQAMPMIAPRRVSLVAVMVLLGLITSGSPAMSVTEDDVENARVAAEQAAQERAGALSDVEAAVAAYEDINGRIQELTFRMGKVRSTIEEYAGQSRDLRHAITDRAVQSYMRGKERDPVAQVFSSGSVQQALIAREVLARAVDSESAALDRLLATTAEMQRLRDQLDADTLETTALKVEAELIVGRMNELFVIATEAADTASAELTEVSEALADQRRREEEERRRREEEERRRQEEEQRRQEALAAAGNPAVGVPEWVTPGFLCPIDAPTWFIDSWGAPRSGGRSHKGTDMFAAFRAPVVAAADGVVSLSYGNLGGNIVWLHADHGVSYFYAHLDGYPDGLASGQRVQRGELIGFNGDTGNSDPGAYHVHFGIYPGGTTAVNPYSTVARACS